MSKNAGTPTSSKSSRTSRMEEPPVSQFGQSLKLQQQLEEVERANRALSTRLELCKKTIARLKLERRLLFDKWQQERARKGLKATDAEFAVLSHSDASEDDQDDESGGLEASLSEPPTVALLSRGAADAEHSGLMQHF